MKKNKRLLTTLVLATLCAAACSIYAADLPVYFDWRLTDPAGGKTDTNLPTDAIVGDVRNQTPYDDCWAFATTASLESSINLKIQAANKQLPDSQLPPVQRLSERYLAWLTGAKPLDGSGDGFYFDNINPTTPKAVYDDGDTIYQPVSTLVRYGVDYNTNVPYVTDPTDASMAGVNKLSGNGAALHDCYGLQIDTNDKDNPSSLNKNINYYKAMLQKCGVLRVNYYMPGTTVAEKVQKDICTTTFLEYSHAVSLVGWDDNYTITGVDGKTHTGAWLMRNSWGTEIDDGNKVIPVGDNGYFYLSYDDATTSSAMFYNAETD